MRMLNFLRDREKYPYKGELTKYINGDKIVFNYRYNENETMENDYYEGKNELVLRCVIEIEGEPKIVVGDKVVLQNGHKFKIYTITNVYSECNPIVMDCVKLKPTSLICELR